MKHNDAGAPSLHLELHNNSTLSYKAEVVIPQSIVDALYTEAIVSQQHAIEAPGFSRGTVPFDYIAQNFKSSIVEHLKELFFNYFVISFLYKELRNQKILIAGEPRLQNIDLEPGKPAVFTFYVNIFPAIEINEWKHLPFKAPKRKKYKDLDRQVDSFLKEEIEHFNKHDNITAAIGDWVNFDIAIVSAQGKPIIENYNENLWFKLGEEEADKPLQDIFIGKKIGDTFLTTNKGLQIFFSEYIDTHYTFSITIIDILHNSYFCIDQFKRYFKLKTNKDIYQKLIEVFSYRNDLSQRRSMAEESLKLLLSKHRFEIPKHIILRQQKKVLNAVQANPDYHVYRMQKDFTKRVKQLAEKQTKELLLLDQIAYLENISVTNQDAKQYLNLTQRPRTKEFIYLASPHTRLRGQEAPIQSEELKQACLREKTLNHIIYHLTKT